MDTSSSDNAVDSKENDWEYICSSGGLTPESDHFSDDIFMEISRDKSTANSNRISRRQTMKTKTKRRDVNNSK